MCMKLIFLYIYTRIIISIILIKIMYIKPSWYFLGVENSGHLYPLYNNKNNIYL